MDNATSTNEMDPIDILEHIANSSSWAHARPDEYSLIIERPMKHGTYGLTTTDEEDLVRFICVRDFTPPGFAILEFYRLLDHINEAVSPGAFTYDAVQQRIKYRTTLDFSDERPLAAEMIKQRVQSMLLVLDATYYCFEAVCGKVINAQQLPDTQQQDIICLNPAMTAIEAIMLFQGIGVGHA